MVANCLSLPKSRFLPHQKILITAEVTID